MPSLADMLNPRCPKHPHVSTEKAPCWLCTPLETPQQREARMAEFHRRFPALGLAAIGETGQFVQENADHDPRDDTLYWEPKDE